MFFSFIWGSSWSSQTIDDLKQSHSATFWSILYSSYWSVYNANKVKNNMSLNRHTITNSPCTFNVLIKSNFILFGFSMGTKAGKKPHQQVINTLILSLPLKHTRIWHFFRIPITLKWFFSKWLTAIPHYWILFLSEYVPMPCFSPPY